MYDLIKLFLFYFILFRSNNQFSNIPIIPNPTTSHSVRRLDTIYSFNSVIYFNLHYLPTNSPYLPSHYAELFLKLHEIV